jgi:hypothetical protein
MRNRPGLAGTSIGNMNEKTKTKQRKTEKAYANFKPAGPPSMPREKASLISRILNLALTISGIVGLIIFADWAYDQYERTTPEIHAVDSDPATSFVLPFFIKNRSVRFDMTNVTLSCGIELATFEDFDKKLYGVGQAIANSDVTLRKIDEVPVNYPCNAEGILRAQVDGRLRLGGLLTQPGVVHSQLKVKNMCVWIGVKYETFGIRRSYISPMFEWIVTPTGHKWLEGPLVSGQKTDVVQTCPERSTPPFMRLRADDEAPLLQFTF